MHEEYFYTETGQLINLETAEIVPESELEKLHEKEFISEFERINAELINRTGKGMKIRIVKDTRGKEYHSLNVKEGFHFVKMFKVDIRDMLETTRMSIISRGFIYSCIAYMHFPANTLIINGDTPTNEVICDKFMVGKTKLFEIYKELEQLEIIKRKKFNGQYVIYLNPFLHSSGLVDVETYNMFANSIYNPHK